MIKSHIFLFVLQVILQLQHFPVLALNFFAGGGRSSSLGKGSAPGITELELTLHWTGGLRDTAPYPRGLCHPGNWDSGEEASHVPTSRKI